VGNQPETSEKIFFFYVDFAKGKHLEKKKEKKTLKKTSRIWCAF